MPNQVAIIGLGRFGATMARTLYQAGHDVLAIDRDPSIIREITGEVTYPVEGDATDERFLREVGILEYDVAVVSIGSDIQSSLLTTVLLYSLREEQLDKRHRRRQHSPKKLDRGTFIVARAKNELHANALSRLGADKVVQIEREAGQELVHLVVAPYKVRPFIEHYMSITPDFSITKLQVPPPALHHTLRSIKLGRPRDRYGLVIIAIRRGKELVLTPDEDEELLPGDVIIVGGRTELLDRLVEPVEQNGENGNETEK